jgi:hypothetical protein
MVLEDAVGSTAIEQHNLQVVNYQRRLRRTL